MLSSAPRETSRSRRITGRPPERFEATTVAASPSTRRIAPFANRSSSSLACSTKNEPSSPCGFPTRPTRTSSSATEDCRCLVAARDGEDILPRELLRDRPATRADRLRGGVEVELGAAELDVFADDRPVRAGLLLVRHPDAAGIDEADLPHPAILLHVRVAGDHEPVLDPFQEAGEPLVGRGRRDDLLVGAGRRVDEERIAEDELSRQALQPGDLVLGELLPDPNGIRGARVLAIGVAADAMSVERADELERLLREGPGRDVAAEDDLVDVLAFYFLQHGLECRQVSVYVAERRYPQPPDDLEHHPVI